MRGDNAGGRGYGLRRELTLEDVIGNLGEALPV